MFYVSQRLHNIHRWESGTPDLKAFETPKSLDRDARLDLGYSAGTVHGKILLRPVL